MLRPVAMSAQRAAKGEGKTARTGSALLSHSVSPLPNGPPLAESGEAPVPLPNRCEDNSSSYVTVDPPAAAAEMTGAADAAAAPSVPASVAFLLFTAALAQNFSSGCISLLIYQDLAFQPVEATRYWMYVGLTMWFQPVVGWLSDSFVLFGERRRPLLALSSLCSAFIYFLYYAKAEVTENHTVFMVLSLVNQLFVMGTYIPLNGLLVEVGKKEQETADESGARMGAVMSQAMTIRSVGSLGGSLVQTLLLVVLSVRSLLGVTAVLQLLLVAILLHADRSLFVQHNTSRPRHPNNSGEEGNGAEAGACVEMCGNTRDTCKKVQNSFDVHDVHSDGFCFVLVLLFVLFYNAMPDGSTVYSAYLFSEFNFPTWFYSMNSLIGTLGATVGAYCFSAWMDHRARQQQQGQTGPSAADGRVDGAVDDERAGRNARPRTHHPQSHADGEHEQGEAPRELVRSRLSTSIYFVFVVGSVVWALAYLTNLLLCTGFVTNVLHIPAKVFVPVDSFFVALCVRFAFMPTIIMAAEHAPRHFEATAFEVFSVASMAGGTLSSLVTSFIAQGMGITRDDNSRLYQVLLVSIVCKLVPIPVAYFLPARRHCPDAEQSDEDGQEEQESGEVADDEARRRHGGKGGSDAGDAVGVNPDAQRHMSRESARTADTRGEDLSSCAAVTDKASAPDPLASLSEDARARLL